MKVPLLALGAACAIDPDELLDSAAPPDDSVSEVGAPFPELELTCAGEAAEPDDEATSEATEPPPPAVASSRARPAPRPPAEPAPVAPEAPPQPPPPPAPPPTPEPPPGPTRAFLTVSVNGMVRPPVPVTFDEGQVVIPASELEEIGLVLPPDAEIDDDGLVSLGSLGEDVQWEVDEEAMHLEVVTDPTRFAGREIDLGASGPPSGTVYTSDGSAFLNYGLLTTDLERLDGTTELGVSVRSVRAFTGLTFPNQAEPVRGLSSVTADFRERMVRAVAGDAFASGGTLGGAAFVGGVQVSRSFSLDPYFYPGPSLDRTATVLTPSTLEVYGV